jgi:hypothetical protein
MSSTFYYHDHKNPVRHSVTFCNAVLFYGEVLLALNATSKLEDQLSGCL